MLPEKKPVSVLMLTNATPTCGITLPSETRSVKISPDHLLPSPYWVDADFMSSIAPAPGEYSGEMPVHEEHAEPATPTVVEPVSTSSANVWPPIVTLAV